MKYVRCHTRLIVGGRAVERGCGRIWDGHTWRFMDPLTAAEDNGLCGKEHGGVDCSGAVASEQKRRRVQLEDRTALRIARGFGAGDPEHAFD